MILAVHNPKGGVGKTTTAVNVAAVLAGMGRKVLLMDLEPYAGSSISLGLRPKDLRPSIADVLVDRVRPVDAVRTLPRFPNLHLITGSLALAQIDSTLHDLRYPERRLADVVHPLAAAFDYVIIDSPVGFSLVSFSVPLAAQHLVVPVTASYLPLEALAQFLRWYRDLRRTRKGLAGLLGIVLTLVDNRAQATREIVDIIRVHNREGVFKSEIPRDPRVTEAPSHGQPLVRYAPRSAAAVAYQRLTDEILHRLSTRAR
ncbi:MAG TPA: ParA family protein [Vicinamibacterales bacterium]|jgi:chromosome partitioning protein|nr:ParA family protein [Vicinamibacterales bacterium]